MSNEQSEMESKKPEKKSTAERKKDNKPEIIQNLIRIIDGFDRHPWGKFPRRFLIARDKSGHPLWLERSEDDVVWLSSCEAVAETLQKYIEKIPKAPPYFHYHQLKGVAELWALHTKPIKLDDVSVVQQKSETGLTWHRLEYDFAPGETPMWDEITGRMENAQAFLAWFGSLFDAKSDRAQYIWLSGSGDNSKGTIIDMLAHIFGKDRGFKSAEPWDKRPGQFWKRMILGSRVVCFPECNDPKFVVSEGFKSLTGDSFHSLDGKFADIFTAELNCKFLIASNEDPSISGEWAERKRLIHCHMQPILPENFLPKSILYPKLIAELPAFCYKALAMYRSICPNGDRIPVNQAGMELLVEKSEEMFHAMFEKYFVMDRDAEITNMEMHEFRIQHDIRLVQDIQWNRFKKFLTRLGIKRTRPKDKVIYKGLRKSAFFERQLLTLEALNETQEKIKNGSEKLSKVNGNANGNGHHAPTPQPGTSGLSPAAEDVMRDLMDMS